MLYEVITVMKGYYLEPEKTAEVLSPDGWFRTGDLVTMSKGYLTIRGRAKNMILGSNGENIYPENIENLISRESSPGNRAVRPLRKP